MDCEIIVSKEQPAHDGLNARQRRRERKRLASAPHLDEVARSLRNRRLKQSNRWLNYMMKTGEIRGYEQEIRWGLRTGNTHLMSSEAQFATDRLDRERSAALSQLNREKKMANPSAKDEVWVDDWFGQADVESVAGGVGGNGVGVTAEAGPVIEKDEDMEMESESVGEGKGLEGGKDAKEVEMVDDFEYMSGVEMDGDGL